MPRAQRTIDVHTSLLRPAEVAAELGCHLASVYREMDRGNLKWVGVLERGRRIRREDLDTYITSRLRGGWNQNRP